MKFVQMMLTSLLQGSVFFPLPDGTGLLYNLVGSADPPKQSGLVIHDIPCKTPHTEVLTVSNWLPRSQRFKLSIEMIKPEKLDRSVTLTGADYIEVPALGSKDFELKYFSFKEGQFHAKVGKM